MALSASIIWEIRPGSGSDTQCSGGFKSGASGTDWSLFATAHATLTTLSVVNATTTKITVSLTDYTVALTDIGNVLQVTGGTATAGFYEITGVDTTLNTWTVDRSVGTAAQTVVGYMGGALLSPGFWSAKIANNNVGYLKNDGTIASITSATAGISGGVISPASAGVLVGYSTNRTINNTDSAPTIQLNVSTATMFGNSGGGITPINIILDGNTQTAAKLAASAIGFIRCTIKNFNTASSGSAAYWNQCVITTNSAAVCIGSVYDSEIYANTGTPIACSINNLIARCLIYGNTGVNTDGCSCGNIIDSVVYGNGRDGVRFTTGSGPGMAINVISEGNGGKGYNSTGALLTILKYCASGSNSGGRSAGILSDENAITLTATAFTAAGSNDFSLNNTTGGGALLRNLGFPGLFPRGTTTGYPSVGAVEYLPAGGFAGGVFGG